MVPSYVYVWWGEGVLFYITEAICPQWHWLHCGNGNSGGLIGSLNRALRLGGGSRNERVGLLQQNQINLPGRVARHGFGSLPSADMSDIAGSF